ncbi:DUF4417 domain-containing protein [Chakrabartyella piscis]|uniref:DUF4417 domain-containing protein n=1 Tax=Chakrabartyella piscis TaxID=2918914 RepID=UPI002958C0F9|nr:DUF4417 domain-containing protein [Chakrabartyella piscis]
MSEKRNDIFHAFLLKNANYDGIFEIPIIKPTNSIPTKVIPFSKAYTARKQKNIDYDMFISFYEHDDKFERVWNRPDIYLPFLQKFKGVISPDFSLYRNMPLIMQGWNTYRGKALAHYFQENGIIVIPNVRFGDERTFDFCFDGVPKNSIVSVGTHGCIKQKLDKYYFKIGLEQLVNVLSPHTIVVYGSAPDELFLKYKQQGIHILQFHSSTSQYHDSKKVVI